MPTTRRPAAPTPPAFWHHGTPNIGAPPEPLFAAADRLAIRWVSYSTGLGTAARRHFRAATIGSAAADVAAVVDALGVDRFAVLGHSGGGPHVLVCAVLIPTVWSPPCARRGWRRSPPRASIGSWAWSRRALPRCGPRPRAGRRRPPTRRREWRPPRVHARGHGGAVGRVGWLGTVVGPAVAAGPGGLIDDDIAYVSPWGFDPGSIEAPVLFVHGGRDRIVPSVRTACGSRSGADPRSCVCRPTTATSRSCAKPSPPARVAQAASAVAALPIRSRKLSQ